MIVHEANDGYVTTYFYHAQGLRRILTFIGIRHYKILHAPQLTDLLILVGQEAEKDLKDHPAKRFTL